MWALKSKTFWAGIGLMAYAILKYVLFGEFDVNAFLTGLGFIGVRHALAKQEFKKKRNKK